MRGALKILARSAGLRKIGSARVFRPISPFIGTKFRIKRAGLWAFRVRKNFKKKRRLTTRESGLRKPNGVEF